MGASLFDRMNIPAMLVLAPTIIVAASLALFEGRALMGPSTMRDSDLSEASFAEALRQGDMELAFATIRAGRNPNSPVAFRDQVLTGGRDIMIAPLLIAVAYNRDDSVAMLMGYGARLDAPGNRFAVCLARQLGYEAIASLVTRDGGPEAARATCPDRKAAREAPLLAYVE